MEQIKNFPEIAVCGLDCGLCPRYYTSGPSRCPGCGGPDFLNKHPSCSFITCCVRRNHHEVCGECPDFPCSKFKSDKEYQQSEESFSYPSQKKILPNLYFIKEHGIADFMLQQKKRIELLKTMIENFDDGRSKSFFCRAATLIEIKNLNNSIEKATRKIRTDVIDQNDLKSKATIIKEFLNKAALEESVELTKKSQKQ